MRYVENGVPEDFARITFKGLNVPLRELTEEEYLWVVFGVKKELPEKTKRRKGILGTNIINIDDSPLDKDMPIDVLELSVRAENCLHRANVLTIKALCSMTEGELTRLRNMGAKTIKEVKTKLSAFGYKLREE